MSRALWREWGASIAHVSLTLQRLQRAEGQASGQSGASGGRNLEDGQVLQELRR